jgi:retinol-binding protein 3
MNSFFLASAFHGMRVYMALALCLASAYVMLGSHAASAQAVRPSPPSPPHATVDTKIRMQIVEAVITQMNARYVFPDVAKALEADLRKKLAAGTYNSAEFNDAKTFAERLTQDVLAVTKDKHLRVRHSPTVLPSMDDGGPTPKELEEMRQRAAVQNFGFDRVERLRFNIGYLDLRGFVSAQIGGHKAAAAMTLLADTDALIVDLRQNGGGDPAMVALLTSYLVDERTLLNTMSYREAGATRTEEWWTNTWVPGERFGGKKPIYVLTAKRTFSAAEEFSYNLKNLKRATIVGETTGGGAHPGRTHRLNDHFFMFISNGRAVNPISKTNWEGTGVEPDIKVEAADALRVAQLSILKGFDTSKRDDEFKRQLTQRIEELEMAAPKK